MPTPAPAIGWAGPAEAASVVVSADSRARSPVAFFEQAATIDDPAILGEVAESLQGAGYAKEGLNVAAG